MKKMDCFIFEPGMWLGEGKVKLSISDEELKYVTRWNINKTKKNGHIVTMQEVQITGVSDMMNNQFSFYDFGENSFKVELENQTFGKVTGSGIYRPALIAWEFRLGDLGFEGFEMYQLQEDGGYFMHAEYLAQEDFRTQIQGRIWKKVAS